MQIVFSNGQTVDLILQSTPVASVYQKTYKHLQHIPVPFRDWDNPFYFDNQTHSDLVEKLILYASKVGVQINKESCLAQDQNYFNSLHRIYEKNYNGHTTWLDFHEHIHACEKHLRTNSKFMTIDYREMMGMLEVPIDPVWQVNRTTKICAGDVFIQWSELGKSPYTYWKHNEPDDQHRMQELAKPWLRLIPKIQIALEDLDCLNDVDTTEFNAWWKNHSQEWCRHWNISDWTVKDIFGVVVLGRTQHVEEITTLLKNNQTPVRVLL